MDDLTLGHRLRPVLQFAWRSGGGRPGSLLAHLDGQQRREGWGRRGCAGGGRHRGRLRVGPRPLGSGPRAPRQLRGVGQSLSHGGVFNLQINSTIGWKLFANLQILTCGTLSASDLVVGLVTTPSVSIWSSKLTLDFSGSAVSALMRSFPSGTLNLSS